MLRIKQIISGVLDKIVKNNPDAPCSVRIFETEGCWKFRTLNGAQTWGNYDSYERARRVAEKYNFILVEEGKK